MGAILHAAQFGGAEWRSSKSKARETRIEEKPRKEPGGVRGLAGDHFPAPSNPLRKGSGEKKARHQTDLKPKWVWLGNLNSVESPPNENLDNGGDRFFR